VFKTLYGRLALALFVGYGLMLLFLVQAMDVMFDKRHIPELITQLVFGAVILALVMGMVVFAVLTRRLRELANSVDAFCSSGFSKPVRVGSSNPNGDEIDRLGFAFVEMEKRMIEQLERLQRIDMQRRELLANVSHDLRTPLASMRGYLETLILKEDSLSREEQRHYLEVAAKQTERLSKLVDDLFQLTKFDAREVVINAETFPITELIQDVAQKFGLAADQKDIRIDTDFVESLPAVHADIRLIERVLENLIENALRHCTNGAVVRLSLSLNPAQDRVVVQVTDTGCGIAPEDLPHVFNRYYQAERNYSGAGGGAGLGLAITLRILDLHEADIQVDSQPGVGTTFRFDLPVAA